MSTPLPAASSNPPPQRLNTALVVVTAAAAAELAPVWGLSLPDIGPTLMRVLPPLLDKWGTAAGSAAAEWYDQLRVSVDVPGRFRARVKLLDEPGAEALAGWGAQALKTAPAVAPKPELLVPQREPVKAKPTPKLLRAPLDPVEAARYRVEGGLQKRLVNTANLTVTDNTVRDAQARGYMRRTRPSDTYPAGCKFCQMVASRGAVYTKASATFACHEQCHCEAVPAWGGQPLPVGPYKPSARPMSSEDRARVKKWIADNLS